MPLQGVLPLQKMGMYSIRIRPARSTAGRPSSNFWVSNPLRSLCGLQELEETVYWLELPVDSGIIKKEQMAVLMKEADELIASLVSIAKTVKIRKNRK